MKTTTHKWLKAFGVFAWIAAVATQANAMLLLEYNFDEASSGNGVATNKGSLGTIANGIFSGAATRTNNTPAGYPLGVLALNPQGLKNDYVGPTNHISALAGLSDITVSTWINVSSLAPSYSMIAQDQNWNTGGGWGFYADGTPSAM